MCNKSLFISFVCCCYFFEIQVYYAQLFPFISVEPSVKIKSQCDGEHSQNIEKRVFNLVRVEKKVTINVDVKPMNSENSPGHRSLFCGLVVTLKFYQDRCYPTLIPVSLDRHFEIPEKENAWQYFAFSSLKMWRGVWCNIE